MVINNEFSVRGVRVVEGEKGAFVAMPSKKIGSDYTDVAFPVTKEAREAINNAVLKSYEQLMASPEKTIKNNLPTAEQSKSSVSVQLKPVENNAHIKAAGQVTIDGCIVVKDVKVITLHIQLASVHKHITAGLNKISSYGQLVSVEVKSSS